MLYMAGGGRIGRVHGPFVSDGEVEKIVAHLKAQGQPEYLSAITEEETVAGEDDDEGGGPVSPIGSMDEEEAGDIYDRAVNIVLRDRNVSTSYIQRRLSVGYNKAASLDRADGEGRRRQPAQPLRQTRDSRRQRRRPRAVPGRRGRGLRTLPFHSPR